MEMTSKPASCAAESYVCSDVSHIWEYLHRIAGLHIGLGSQNSDLHLAVGRYTLLEILEQVST